MEDSQPQAEYQEDGPPPAGPASGDEAEDSTPLEPPKPLVKNFIDEDSESIARSTQRDRRPEAPAGNPFFSGPPPRLPPALQKMQSLLEVVDMQKKLVVASEPRARSRSRRSG